VWSTMPGSTCFYCGKVHILKLTILAMFEVYRLVWHEDHLHCCGAITTVLWQNSSSSKTEALHPLSDSFLPLSFQSLVTFLLLSVLWICPLSESHVSETACVWLVYSLSLVSSRFSRAVACVRTVLLSKTEPRSAVRMCLAGVYVCLLCWWTLGLLHLSGYCG
jgi:hypothetical protein